MQTTWKGLKLSLRVKAIGRQERGGVGDDEEGGGGGKGGGGGIGWFVTKGRRGGIAGRVVQDALEGGAWWTLIL